MPETKEQANRRTVAEKLAAVLMAEGISRWGARTGGMFAVSNEQQTAQDYFRLAVARKAGCREGYLPSDATWALACSMIPKEAV